MAVCCIIQRVSTQHTLTPGISYPLFSGCRWSGSPTNALFPLSTEKASVAHNRPSSRVDRTFFRIAGTLLPLTFQVHPGTSDRVCFYCECDPKTPGKIHLNRWLLANVGLPGDDRKIRHPFVFLLDTPPGNTRRRTETPGNLSSVETCRMTVENRSQQLILLHSPTLFWQPLRRQYFQWLEWPAKKRRWL